METTHTLFEGETVRFGVIGCGLMGREFASAAARHFHLDWPGPRPELVAACDLSAEARSWFERHVPTLALSTDDYREVLARDDVDAVYVAVPHNLHEEVYTACVEAGKHLLGEKPFGIDRAANDAINGAIDARPDVLVRCASEFPFYPGAYRIGAWARAGRFGEVVEAEAGFWHSSDLNPDKPINWKRTLAMNGEYGCMGDLGMHVLHLPLRLGWRPTRVAAELANVMTTRPDGSGKRVPCETWDNALLLARAEATGGAQDGQSFPLRLSTKRIAPGHANTWFVRVWGTEFSAEFSTRNPKEIRSLPYAPGGPQAWHVEDVPFKSAYPAITGGIFEFGFSDAIQQMWAAFCDELAHGRDGMAQPLYCATPEEAALTHSLFTAALASQDGGRTVALGAGGDGALGHPVG